MFFAITVSINLGEIDPQRWADVLKSHLTHLRWHTDTSRHVLDNSSVSWTLLYDWNFNVIYSTKKWAVLAPHVCNSCHSFPCAKTTGAHSCFCSLEVDATEIWMLQQLFCTWSFIWVLPQTSSESVLQSTIKRTFECFLSTLTNRAGSMLSIGVNSTAKSGFANACILAFLPPAKEWSWSPT